LQGKPRDEARRIVALIFQLAAVEAHCTPR
jgi:hypothetical protein